LGLVDFYPAIIIHKDKELDRDIEYILRYRWDCSKISYKVYTENPMGEVDG